MPKIKPEEPKVVELSKEEIERIIYCLSNVALQSDEPREHKALLRNIKKKLKPLIGMK